ncbi:MAG TPA: trypsin-like peptidase domain-containing protein [Gemmataceae bacterium]|jgi:serine protease Do
MTKPFRLPPGRPCGPRFALALLLGLSVRTLLHAESRPAAFDKPVPQTVQDLRIIQERVKKVVAKVSPATVGIRFGNNAGSGVIVSKDGYVLTAGHISGKADRRVTVILPDGRRLKAKTLGSNGDYDSGMIRITDEGDWPFVEMGDSEKLKKGDWCLALGHPDGYKPGRSPVLRLGRVLSLRKKTIRTDCALVGGDSGGPLFDLSGKVIGIHSRIGSGLSFNIHVPVDTYRETWDRLVKGEVWGPTRPYIGVILTPDAKECRIAEVKKGSPAEKGGLQPDDVVLRCDKKKIGDLEGLIDLIGRHKPGDELSLEVRRGTEIVNLKVVVGNREE